MVQGFPQGFGDRGGTNQKLSPPRRGGQPGGDSFDRGGDFGGGQLRQGGDTDFFAARNARGKKSHNNDIFQAI